MNKKNKLLLSFLLFLNTVMLSNCCIFTPYSISIEQGKIISKVLTKNIYPGMNKQQVIYLLGSPDIIDPFTKEQWNYIYFVKGGIDKNTQQKKLVLVFDHNNKLKKAKENSFLG